MIGKKGTYGYLRTRRHFMIFLTIALLAVVFAMYFGARAYFGTNKNVFTILAALCCIGVGKSAVDMIMFLRAKGCSENAHRAIEMHIGKLAGSYDIYLTSYEKNFPLSHVTTAGKSVCALTESSKCDTRAGELHIRTMMENGGFHGYTVKIFRSLDKYLERLDEMNRLDEHRERRSIEEVMRLFHSISL